LNLKPVNFLSQVALLITRLHSSRTEYVVSSKIKQSYQVSTNSLHRWCDDGRIQSIRTLGGNDCTLESVCLESLGNNLRNEDFRSYLITYIIFNLRDENFQFFLITHFISNYMRFLD
jgi:hypothetical protein